MENNNTVLLDLIGNTNVLTEQRTKKIRELNDQFRRSLQGGLMKTTSGIASLGAMAIMKILNCVRVFDDFSEANDPWEEHDFGSFHFAIGENDDESVTVCWKIDYYDKACEYGSEDPSDPAKTTRVLTIYLSSEH